MLCLVCTQYPALTWTSSWLLWIKYAVLCLQPTARGSTALSTRVLLLDGVPRNHNRARNKTILNLDVKRSGFANALLYIHSNETTNTSEIFQSPPLHKRRYFPFPPCQNFSEEGNLCALGSLAVNVLSCSSTCVIAWCLQSQLINMCMHYLLPGWLEKHLLAWYVFLLHLQGLPASHSLSKYYIYWSNLFTVGHMPNWWKMMVWPGKTSGEASPPSMLVLLVLLIRARRALKHGYQFYTDVAFRP